MSFAQISRSISGAWKALVVALLLGAALGYAAGRLMAPGWTSSAAVVMSSATNEGAPSLLARVPSYAQLATSQRVLAPVSAQFDVEDLSSQITGTYGDGTYLVLVSGTDPDQGRAIQLTEAVANSYTRELNGGFGGAITKAQAVDASVVEHADTAEPAGKLSPPVLAVLGAALLPLLLLSLLIVRDSQSAERRAARSVTRRGGSMQTVKSIAPLATAAVVGAVVGAIATAAIHSPYVSRATLLVSPNTAEGAATFLDRVPTLAQFGSTDSVLGPAAARLGMSGGAQSLAPMVKVSSPAKTILINVEASAPEASRSHDIAAAVSEQLRTVLLQTYGREKPTNESVNVAVVDPAQVAKRSDPVSPPIGGLVGALLGIGLAYAIRALVRAARSPAPEGTDGAEGRRGSDHGDTARVPDGGQA